ncbi:hypothetical protein B0H10DRAFT_1747774, partial [Mycena sp. CBHHK59/15]
EFRFNVTNAILGVLEPLDDTDIDADNTLPFKDFLVTRYLPCGPTDQPIMKFTGNTDCGDPPKNRDPLTTAIHAFTHYNILLTEGNLLLCDLQG